ncbi:hypothetical protein BB559_001875 [Furculomyces boomerangus]|uniref:RNA polymerase I-specific transcription initiation factor RRN3 n=1 Tax=Furculomyces boomerangus TaxID=61424 RepID=A0A2T9YZW2_9FUNG|nr:hypothetical protein BB559_001875 [Furculomyces boomerangus]
METGLITPKAVRFSSNITFFDKSDYENSDIIRDALSLDSGIKNDLPQTPQFNSPADFNLQAKKKKEMLRLFIKKALENVKSGRVSEYHEIIKVFNDIQPKNISFLEDQKIEKIKSWIEAILYHVSLIESVHYELIEAILGCKCICFKNEELVSKYNGLLLHIASVQPSWSSRIIKTLIKWFLYKPHSDAEVAENILFSRIHSVINDLIYLIPTLSREIYTAINRAFPHKRATLEHQKQFLENTLRVLEYYPELQKKLLQLIFDRILQIDVEIQADIEELEEKQNQKDNEDDDVSSGSETEEDNAEILELKNISKNKKSNETLTEASTELHDEDEDLAADDDYTFNNEVLIYNEHEMIEKLDVMMYQVLTFLQKSHTTNKNNRIEQFALVLELFDQIVLPTFKSRYTQFFMFYVCSLESNYSDLFLGHLVTKIGQPVEFGQVLTSSSRSSIIRMSAASYLSSFVARASFLSPQIVRNVIGVLSQWANTYIDLQDDYETSSPTSVIPKHLNKNSGFRSKYSDTSKFEHPVFYSVCQAIMYIFCFRWRDLVESKDGDNSLLFDQLSESQSMENGFDTSVFRWCPQVSGIHRVVFSKLNPLAFISSTVSKQFALVGSQLSFIFCLSLLDQNKRSNRRFVLANSNNETGSGSTISLPSLMSSSSLFSLGSSLNALRGGSNPGLNTLKEMSTFFPFDPIILPLSKPFIDPVYMEWNPVFETNSDSDISDDSDLSDGDDDDTKTASARNSERMEISL